MANVYEVHMPNPLYEKLILEVKERPFLWDVSHEKYRCKKDGVVAWRNIAKTLNISVHVAQTQWRMLRCIFRRYIKKYEPNTLNDYVGKWRYFHSLWFLRNGLQDYPIERKLVAKDVVNKKPKVTEGRKISSSSSTSSTNESSRDNKDESNIHDNNGYNPAKPKVIRKDNQTTKIKQQNIKLSLYRPANDNYIHHEREEYSASDDEELTPFLSTSSIIRKTASIGDTLKVEWTQDEVSDDIIVIENNNKEFDQTVVTESKNTQPVPFQNANLQSKEVLQRSEIAPVDSDELFLNSLSSFLQKLPPARRLAVRSRFQKILMEEMAR